MSPIRQVWRLIAPVLLLYSLTGCVALYPAGPAQIPYVAVPGPAKTEAQFRQDDTTCRAFAVQLPQEPAQPNTLPPAASSQAQAQALASQVQSPQSDPLPPEPPGAFYLRCMAVRGNPIEPLAASAPFLYAYYQPYPVLIGDGDYYPWLYGGYGPYFGGLYGFGFYHGFGGYGYRGYGGYGGWHGGGYGGWHGGGYGGYHRGGRR